MPIVSQGDVAQAVYHALSTLPGSRYHSGRTGTAMPRTLIEPQFPTERLSILDGDGKLDAKLEPKISPDDLKRLYRAMVLGRRLDERMLKLQRQGRIGTFAPIKGQEAAQIGSVFTLEPRDWMVPSFRDTAAMLWRGWPIDRLLAFYAGRLEGGQPGPEQHDLPVTIPVATQLPHAVGLAYGIQYRGEDAVVGLERGDGATDQRELRRRRRSADARQRVVRHASAAAATRAASAYARLARPEPQVMRATPSACSSYGSGRPGMTSTLIGPSILRARSATTSTGHAIG